ncbi:regulator [Photorhabdus heterorhabditis]|uniref:regulator n=1 Tax=Photorhabdus heterorhabditis TaxID=880156 RepID=UPI001561F6DB|nr:regulator [Photorhabdus heterorhabditis]
MNHQLNVKKDNDASDDFEVFLDSLDGKRIERELAILAKSNKITINQLKSIYNLGAKFYANMQLKEAEAVFLSYSVLSPYDHRGPGSLASIYLEKEEFRKALDLLNVLKTYPTCDLDEVLINIALCHYKLKEYANSSAVFYIVKPENLSDFYCKRYQFLQRQLKPYIDT